MVITLIMYGTLYVRLLGLFAFSEKKNNKRDGVIYPHNF